VSYLFDTNAISEPLRRRPNREFIGWLATLRPKDQYTSIVVVAELLAGAYRAAATAKWLERIEAHVLPSLTVLGFDLECAQQYGRLKALLGRAGTPIGDVDTQIAATALRHGLAVVTANAARFRKVPNLQLETFTPGETGA
jgi:predicted nucleic acid-binding protein